VEALRATARPFVSLVAEAEGCVAGHIAFSPVTVDGMDHGALGLAPMAVAPAHQRRGIGGALMRAGLAACRAAGAPFVVVLGDPAYYGRFGFVPAAHHGLRCEYDVPAGAFQVQALRPGALDGVRGLVRYHTAFATL
jgi:putative acetyltransferase